MCVLCHRWLNKQQKKNNMNCPKTNNLIDCFGFQYKARIRIVLTSHREVARQTKSGLQVKKKKKRYLFNYKKQKNLMKGPHKGTETKNT